MSEDTFLLCQIQTAIVGELLPEATTNAKGLMSANIYKKVNQSITSTKLIQIESWDGFSTLVFIRASNSTGLYAVDGNWKDAARFTKLSGPLNSEHFKAYRGTNGYIYVKTVTSDPLTVTSVGSNHNFTFVESDVDISTLTVLQ